MKKISIWFITAALILLTGLTSCRARKFVPTTEEPIPETRRIYTETETESETGSEELTETETE